MKAAVCQNTEILLLVKMLFFTVKGPHLPRYPTTQRLFIIISIRFDIIDFDVIIFPTLRACLTVALETVSCVV